MPDEATWTRDRCTCGHADTAHENASGRCRECDKNVSYRDRNAQPCTRYQWDGKPRTRSW